MNEPRRPFFGPVIEQLQDWDAPGTVACVTVTALLIVGHYQGSIGSIHQFIPNPPQTRFSELYGFLWWYGSNFALFVPVPLAVAALTPGIRMRDLGLGLGDWRFGLGASGLLLAIMLPVVFIAAQTSEFGGHYPLAFGAKKSLAHLALYEAAYVLYFVAWEFLYRGYLLFSLAPRFGNFAIVIQTVPFALLHLGKPEAEAFGSIAAGLALGVVALRARSFWYGALIHAAVAVTMDLRCALPGMLK